MSRLVFTSTAPATAAHRLQSILHGFPTASVAGVEWRVLMRVYEERHRLPLDIKSLGHSTPLGAASALLWDVLRLTSQDKMNPVIAFDDREVLIPRGNSFAAWPSLYKALCGLVDEAEQEADQGRCKDAVPGVPLSQARSLLRKNWHRAFGQEGLAYLTEEGYAVRLDSTEELVGALLMWRTERKMWLMDSGAQPSALDKALEPELDLTPMGKWGELHICWAYRANTAPPRQVTGSVKLAASWFESPGKIISSPDATSTAAPSEGEEPCYSDGDVPEEGARWGLPEEGARWGLPLLLEESTEPLGGLIMTPEEAEAEAKVPPIPRSQTAPLPLGDRARIPTGAVQQALAIFEREKMAAGTRYL